MHCFYQFLLMSSIFTRILSLAHLFYAYFTHGPNKSASAQYDNTRGAWLTQEGCTITERKEGRKELVQACDKDRRRILGTSVRGVAIGVNVCESKGMYGVCVCVTLPFPAGGMGAL